MRAEKGPKAVPDPRPRTQVTAAMVMANPGPVLVHQEGTVLCASAALGRMFGLRGKDHWDLALSINDLVAVTSKVTVRERQQRLAAGAEELPTADVTMHRITSGLIHVQTVARRVLYQGEEAAYIAAWDLTGNRRQIRRARKALRTDPLTGVGNRAALLERLELFAREPPGPRGGRRPATLLFIDLDNFKRVNDEAGHGVGDQVLHAVAQRLKQTVRKGDVLVRYGGDEFAVLLPRTGPVGAGRVAARIRAELAQPYPQARAVPVAASVGIARVEPGMSVADALAAADRAMYADKPARPGVQAGVSLR